MAALPVARRDLGDLVAIVTAIAAVGLLAFANSRSLLNSFDVSLNDIVGERDGPWVTDPAVTPLILGALGTVLLLFGPLRRFAAGLLIAAGLGGFFVNLDLPINALVNEAPLSAAVIVLFTAHALLFASGSLAACTSAGGSYQPGSPRLLRAVVLSLAALLAVVIVLRPLVLGREVSGSWYLQLPVIWLAVLAAVAGSRPSDADLRVSAGVLVSTGTLVLTDFLLVQQFMPQAPPVWARLVVLLGLFCGGVLAAIGLVMFALGQEVLDDEPDEPDELDGEPVAESGAVPQSLANSAVTRRLCVAAHVQPDLARRTARLVAEHRHRAVPPAFGVDLTTVLNHCLAAYRRQRARDVVLAMLAVPWLLMLLSVLLADSGVSPAALLLAPLVAWLVLLVEEWVSRYHIAGWRLAPAAFDPATRPRVNEADQRRIAAMGADDPGNVTIYARYRPFVGSGVDQGGWSFALSVLKGKELLGGTGGRLTPAHFDVEDLYEAVRRDVESLELDGVVFEDRLYVDGQGIHNDRRFIDQQTGRPLTNLDQGELAKLIRTPELANRVYRCIRVFGWGGEFILSIYLNFARTGRGLFAQARYFLLYPVQDEGQPVPELDRIPVSTLARAGWTALRWRKLKLFLASPVRALRALGLAGRQLITPDKVTDPGFNYGTDTSVRELAQGTKYRRYFQHLDREMIGKIVERQILDTAARFLDAHNIDISELEERQTAILNNGLIVSGGTVEADSIAVGAGANALTATLAVQVGPKAFRVGPKPAAGGKTEG